MVKGIVWVVILAALAGGMLYGIKVMNQDSGQLYGVAMAPPREGVVQLQVLTPQLIGQMDGPDVDDAGQPDWATWIDQHYNLRDAAGTKLPLARIGLFTAQIKEHQAGTAEFILGADLKEGQPYSLEIKPYLGDPKKYIYRFTAGTQEFKRVNFEPNY